MTVFFQWLVRGLFLYGFVLHLHAEEPVLLGVDRFFKEQLYVSLKGKRIGLVMNQTSVDRNMQSTLSLFQKCSSDISIQALFAPEHGLKGRQYAAEAVQDENSKTPVYSLHGKTRRPSSLMLQDIDVLIYDIQCTGVRAYTYATTLFYIMEEAAKKNIQVIVLDRPNPINGLIVDGPLLDEKWRSFIGYVNVPYCHGMTIGELALLFNSEYNIQCNLRVVPMKGWKRSMSYRDTGLNWIPPSPNVPEPDTPLFSSMTGILGELHVVNIGIGFSLPFKIVGAPWISAVQFAESLNAQKLPGVRFHPFYFRPFWGLYKGLDCEGVLIQITNTHELKPLSVQYLLLGLLKSLYPEEIAKRLDRLAQDKDLFCKANGTSFVYDMFLKDPYPAWKLIGFQKEERALFLETRKKYLLQYPEF